MWAVLGCTTEATGPSAFAGGGSGSCVGHGAGAPRRGGSHGGCHVGGSHAGCHVGGAHVGGGGCCTSSSVTLARLEAASSASVARLEAALGAGAPRRGTSQVKLDMDTKGKARQDEAKRELAHEKALANAADNRNELTLETGPISFLVTGRRRADWGLRSSRLMPGAPWPFPPVVLISRGE